MQSVTFEHLNRQNAAPLKTRNQIEHRRRDSTRHRAILSAVREWEATIPGQAQDVVTQLGGRAMGQGWRARDHCETNRTFIAT
ncbi:Uncharacterised protein [Leclercia adecarboxylata]|uniref:Uncharacterized protein n=1 Tax=Leclercia adecarboxylata TaxID=83655 RepID=A0A4U9HR91_9ENTR|nr:Uncharacterised protein [Leclercia adecarboxylata]